VYVKWFTFSERPTRQIAAADAQEFSGCEKIHVIV
jgi:hypothetical protein